jgi:glycopeptidolipid biosynthesis protein
MSINLDGDAGSLFVLVDLVNDEEQRSLWRTFAEVPTGRRVVYGDADRGACLDCTEENLLRIRPKSLRERLAGGRAFDT